MSTRLNSELQRLYQPLTEPDGRVRAMVLALGKPADWDAVSQVWQAVQAELSLPAPAIAVSGLDGYQLWFSLEEAVPLAEVRTFLKGLCDRHLAHIAPERLTCLLDEGARASSEEMPPGREVRKGQWSAFVAPDLAPIFADTPWLDIPPSPEGQADLLSRVRRIKASDWRVALARLQSTQLEPTVSALVVSSIRPTEGQDLEPWHFLRKVMNDETVALALRIEAAKALLPYSGKGG